MPGHPQSTRAAPVGLLGTTLQDPTQAVEGGAIAGVWEPKVRVGLAVNTEA